MRRISLAVLALSPVLLHAQAMVPALSPASKAAPVLQAKLVSSLSLPSTADADSRTFVSPAVASVSMTAPKLIYSVPVAMASAWQWGTVDKYQTGVVEMMVDENGKPSQLKVIESAGWGLNKSLLDAVSKYRFQPGMKNSKPVPMLVDLRVNILNPFHQ